MNIPPLLRTPRLLLRLYTATDREWFVMTSSDSIDMKDVGGSLSQEEAERLFNGIIDGTQARVFGACRAECGGEVVGHGALLRAGEDLAVGYILPQSA